MLSAMDLQGLFEECKAVMGKGQVIPDVVTNFEWVDCIAYAKTVIPCLSKCFAFHGRAAHAPVHGHCVRYQESGELQFRKQVPGQRQEHVCLLGNLTLAASAKVQAAKIAGLNRALEAEQPYAVVLDVIAPASKTDASEIQQTLEDLLQVPYHHFNV